MCHFWNYPKHIAWILNAYKHILLYILKLMKHVAWIPNTQMEWRQEIGFFPWCHLRVGKTKHGEANQGYWPWKGWLDHESIASTFSIQDMANVDKVVWFHKIQELNHWALRNNKTIRVKFLIWVGNMIFGVG